MLLRFHERAQDILIVANSALLSQSIAAMKGFPGEPGLTFEKPDK